MHAVASITSLWDTYIVHPTRGPGYLWWSGPGSDFGQLTILGTLIVAFGWLLRNTRRMLRGEYHFQCHTEHCRKLGLHPVAGTHFRTCWNHHPVLSLHPHRSVPLRTIHTAYHDNRRT